MRRLTRLWAATALQLSVAIAWGSFLELLFTTIIAAEPALPQRDVVGTRDSLVSPRHFG